MIKEFVREILGDIRLDVVRRKGQLTVLGKNEAVKILLAKDKQNETVSRLHNTKNSRGFCYSQTK